MTVDVSALIPFEPAGSSPEHRAALKSVLVRNLLLALGAWRRNGMLGEAPMVVTIGTEHDTEAPLMLELERDALVVHTGGQMHTFAWDADAQLYSALGELFALRGLSSGG